MTTRSQQSARSRQTSRRARNSIQERSNAVLLFVTTKTPEGAFKLEFAQVERQQTALKAPPACLPAVQKNPARLAPGLKSAVHQTQTPCSQHVPCKAQRNNNEALAMQPAAAPAHTVASTHHSPPPITVLNCAAPEGDS